MEYLAQNKYIRSSYDILDTFEAGLVLFGHEVKAAKNGRMNLKGSYVTIRKDEVFLINSHIGKYRPAGNIDDYNTERVRKLLLSKSQIRHLIGKSKEKGLTIIPLRVYSKRGILKVEIGIARGMKLHDKREMLKKRDIDRRIRSAVKTQY
jgi:SsrA-binding protein